MQGRTDTSKSWFTYVQQKVPVIYRTKCGAIAYCTDLACVLWNNVIWRILTDEVQAQIKPTGTCDFSR